MRNKHILVPLDLVRGPANALVSVQQMAAESPVSITLLHVIDLNVFPPQPQVNQELCAESEAALRKLARLFFGSEQDVKTVVRLGLPADEIIAEAKSQEADLIVMCGPAPRRLRFLRRGTTQRVLRTASCPTLVIPHPGNPASRGARQARRSVPEEACFLGRNAERHFVC